MLVSVILLGSPVALWQSPKNYSFSVSKGEFFQVICIKLQGKTLSSKNSAIYFSKEKPLLKAPEDKRRFPQSCFWSHGLKQVHIVHCRPPRTEQGGNSLYRFLNYKMVNTLKKLSYKNCWVSFYERSVQHTAVEFYNLSF